MVSAMTSYSSWRQGAFLFLGNIRLKAISNSHQWPKHSWRAVFSSSAKHCYYRWITSHFSCKQNSKHKNAELSILAGEDMTPKNPLERRTPTWNSTAQATKMDGEFLDLQIFFSTCRSPQSFARSCNLRISSHMYDITCWYFNNCSALPQEKAYRCTNGWMKFGY